ncbi:hypothetical protein RSW78_25590, partial [Escherichia coli]|uniref:DUF5677 domain-containing protein n=1 Tax=Escherichia coli TaxID=562 RepID=UPI0028DFB1D3
LAEEKTQIEALIEQIRKFPQFLALSERRQAAFIKDRDWGLGRKWPELAEEAGFHPEYFRNVYYFLCDYSHSSWNAAMQTGQATPEHQR